MILIISGIVLFFFLFIGIGLLTFHAKRQGPITFTELLKLFWLGLVVSIAFLQIWHLFAPLNMAAFWLHCLASIAGYLLSYKSILKFVRSLTWQITVPVAITFGLFAALMAIFSIDGKLHFDYGLYHLQTVKWLEEFAIVPGLGNLHHRLAFNNASFLYVALINQGLFTGYSFYISNCLIAWVLSLHSLSSISNLILKKTTISKTDYYYALVFPFFLWHIQAFTFSGYAPDFFVSVLQVVIAGKFIALTEDVQEQQAEISEGIRQILILCVLMVCVKLSGLVFALAFMIACVITYFKKVRNSPFDKKYIITTVVCLLTIGIPWLVRSLLLSGYLLYPSTLISFNVPWKIPELMAEPIAGVIFAWARSGTTISTFAQFSEWLSQWVLTLPPGLLDGWKLGSILSVTMLILLAIKRFPIKQHQGQLLVILFSILHIIYWFIMAPEIRFIGMSFWIAFSVLLSILVIWIGQLYPEWSIKGLTLVVLLFTMLWLNPYVPREVGLKQNLIRPQSEDKIAAEIGVQGELVTKTTSSGLTVYLADDYSKECCWNLPLPCTRANDYYSKLALIDPDDMQKGFYIKTEN